jgi:sialic acid synthase SpsE
MHCVSSYPLTSENCNFKKFDYLKNFFSKVGYSGHYHGVEDALFAIEKGAFVIEKHFTTNNGLPGRDNKFALLPEDFKFLTNYIKKKREFQINKGLGLQKCEKDIYNNYRGRWSK